MSPSVSAIHSSAAYDQKDRWQLHKTTYCALLSMLMRIWFHCDVWVGAVEQGRFMKKCKTQRWLPPVPHSDHTPIYMQTGKWGLRSSQMNRIFTTSSVLVGGWPIYRGFERPRHPNKTSNPPDGMSCSRALLGTRCWRGRLKKIFFLWCQGFSCRSTKESLSVLESHALQ